MNSSVAIPVSLLEDSRVTNKAKVFYGKASCRFGSEPTTVGDAARSTNMATWTVRRRVTELEGAGWCFYFREQGREGVFVLCRPTD